MFNNQINEEEFWKVFDERLKLCYDALMCRYKALKGVKSDVSPIHWQNGVLARLKKGEKIQLVGFGTFEVKTFKSHAAVHPGSGERIVVPSFKNVVFRPGDELTRFVRENKESGA